MGLPVLSNPVDMSCSSFTALSTVPVVYFLARMFELSIKC